MLAYLAPWFVGTATDPVPPKSDLARRTFTLDMVVNGWAAQSSSFCRCPQNDDLNLLYDEAKEAWTRRRGAWTHHGRKLLLGYEYRLCIKLGTATSRPKGMAAAFQRVYIDLRTPKSVGLFGWDRVPPPHRMWVWATDKTKAQAALGLAL